MSGETTERKIRSKHRTARYVDRLFSVSLRKLSTILPVIPQPGQENKKREARLISRPGGPPRDCDAHVTLPWKQKTLLNRMRKRPEMRFHPFLCAKIRHYDENWSALHEKKCYGSEKSRRASRQDSSTRTFSGLVRNLFETKVIFPHLGKLRPGNARAGGCNKKLFQNTCRLPA